jgi:putative transposase
MPDYRRAHVPGGTYFFTVNTYRRQTFLTDVNVRSALREAIGTLRSTHPFVIEGRRPFSCGSARRNAS